MEFRFAWDHPVSEAEEHEHKFLVDPSSAQSFILRLNGRLAPEPFDGANPIRYTRTTYLDTPEGGYLRTSGTGFVRRVRVRQYACAPNLSSTPHLTGENFLELKETRGKWRRKARWSASAIQIIQWLQGRTPPDMVDGCADESFRESLRTLYEHLRRGWLLPCLTTWYRRSQWRACEGTVRLTLDHDVQFSAPVSLLAPGAAPEPALVKESLGLSILELKYVGDPPPWLSSAMCNLEEAQGFSKFGRGMQAVLGRFAASIAANRASPNEGAPEA